MTQIYKYLLSDSSKNSTFILKSSANNLIFASVFNSRSSNSTLIFQFCDSASTRLRLQSFDIRLENEPHVGTPLRRYLGKSTWIFSFPLFIFVLFIFQDFVEAFAKAMNRPSFLPMPDFVWRFVFGPERASMITEGQKVVPRRTLDSGFNFRFSTIDRACHEFSQAFYKDQDEKWSP